MMQQNVAVAQLVKQVCGLAIEAEFARNERLEFEIGAGRCAVQGHDPGEIDRTLGVEDQGLIQLEIRAQAVDDLRIGVGIDLQAHGIAFAPVVQLGAHGLQQRARFFFLEVEIAVARDAKGSAGKDLVSAIHGRRRCAR